MCCPTNCPTLDEVVHAFLKVPSVQGNVNGFLFEMWLITKKAKAHDLPTAWSASLWLFGENTGKVRLVFSRRSWCSAVKPTQERTGPELNTVLYLTWWLSYQKSILQISQTRHTAPRLKILFNSTKAHF